MDVRTAIGTRPGLMDPDWLEAHLHDPDVRVIEVDVSGAAHDHGHIPGAVLWNIYSDLKDGEYRLRDRAAIEALVRRSGIDADSTVVFYGYGPAIGLWLLRWYGHQSAYLLDSDRDAWRDAGRPWTTEASRPTQSYYHLADPDPQVRAGSDQVASAIADPGVTVVDVRSPEEFRGERFWPSGGMEEGGRAGHVPGATQVAVDDVLDDLGAFRSTDELAARWAGVGGDDTELITYCTIGARAATAWFVLTYLLGRTGCRVYDGSWAEWGRSAGLPVER